MRLNTLTVQNCRNIAAATFVPHAGLTVIAGENGQGKTNLLECVYLLTGGKSFRGAKDQQLVRHGEEMAHITGHCHTGGRESAIELTIAGAAAQKRGRFAKVNGVDYGRATAIAGIFTGKTRRRGPRPTPAAGRSGSRR